VRGKAKRGEASGGKREVKEGKTKRIGWTVADRTGEGRLGGEALRLH